MSIVIDTPEGIAFFRALARQGAARLKKPGIIAIIRDVYGFSGSPATVRAMLDDYIECVLQTRQWPATYAEDIRRIAQDAVDRATEEHGDDPAIQQYADMNIQMMFDIGAITESEGNDASLLLFVEVVRTRAGTR